MNIHLLIDLLLKNFDMNNVVAGITVYLLMIIMSNIRWAKTVKLRNNACR